MRARKGLILFFLCFGGMIAPLPAAEEITSVTILTFSGKVEISRRPNVWDPGHTNQVLQVGDRLLGTAARFLPLLRLNSQCGQKKGETYQCFFHTVFSNR